MSARATKRVVRDLEIENHGSVCLIRPVSEVGRAWLDATAPEDAQFFCGAMAVEPRYVEGVVAAALDADLRF